MFMTTHMTFDPWINEETVAEVRHHWDGPYHFGAPDGIVVNVTADQIWVREGILPDFPNQRAPQQDFTNGQLIVPMPPTDRTQIQEPFVREQQINPNKYYPKGYKPQLLEEWPADADIVAPVEALPENLRQSMGDQWRQNKRNQEILEQQNQ